MKKFFIKHKGICALYLCFMILNASIAVIMAELLSEITDFALHGGNEISILLWKIFAFFAYITFIYVCYSNIKARYVQIIMTDLEQASYDSIMRQEIYRFHSKSPSEYSSFFLNDLKMVEENYLKQVPNLLSGLLQMIVISIYVCKLNGWILLLFILSSLIMLWIPKLTGPLIQNKSNRFSKTAQQFTSFLKETFSGFDTIASNHARFPYIAKTSSEFVGYQKEKRNYELAIELSNDASQIFSLTFQLLLIVCMGFLISQHMLSADYLFSIVSISGTFLGNVFTVTQAYTSIQSSKPMRNKLQEIQTFPVIGSEQEFPQNALVLDEVSYAIKERKIIDQLSYTFEKGKRYLIIGESGSGKSTLFHLLSGRLKPDQGTITQDQSGNTDRSFITTIPQTPVSFKDTVFNNITLYRKEKENAVNTVLPAVHLSPELLLKDVEEDHTTISGGELQRISIARALLDPRSFLLCDESTANLDPETSKIIEHAVTNLQDVGILWITHHVTAHTIQSFDVILKLEHGTLHDVSDKYKKETEKT
ncbi:ATP-binding cassette domain-containing protein [Dubosiella newyorkensis]|uniref:ATP-binding cassette domain-containing protein n=1 Tax=Dubosiella newyorkensis TaxID=1862672 RepID=UPI00272AB550|nr:ABC transporter ATP-binding protein [Dubosiella newyorkensis]